MTKLTMTVAMIGILTLAGCAVGNREPSTVRTGPQVEDPTANSPGGKVPAGGSTANAVVIDDSASQIDRFAAGATSIIITNFR